MSRMNWAVSLPLLAVALGVSGCATSTPVRAADHVAETQTETANKQLVIDFYNKAINDKDYEAAARYLGDTYIQHNQTAPDGPEGLKTFIAFLRKSFPQQHNEIKHAYADGDTVILHVHSVRTPGERGRAIADIFRVDNGKVVEHWDVIQEIPPADEARNSNTMF